MTDQPVKDMIQVYIDADGCPVKDEVFKVAKRYRLRVTAVSNTRMKIPFDALFRAQVVSDDFDAADNWIVDHCGAVDIVVTADILLAARCLEKGSRVLDPKGRVFTENSIGSALVNREVAGYLRDLGEISGGPAPFQPRDRSNFLQKLDALVQAAMKSAR